MPRRTTFRAAGLVLTAALALASLAGVATAAVSVTHGEIESFDGVKIDYSLFKPDGASAENKVPVIFMTHGWGGTRVVDPANGTVARLLGQGYAVLTWDQRGFGSSGGEANADSQEFEVRDVQALISFVADQEGILTDDAESFETIQVEVPCPSPSPSTSPSPGPSPSPSPSPQPCFEEEVIRHPPVDPVMGMLGGSYAGGIQLMTASADPRVDAIVPQIAWNDLPQSLKPGGVLKLGWDLLLYGSGLATATANGLPAETGAYSPHIHQSLVEGVALNDWSTATYDWFAGKSPARYINGATLADGTDVPGISAPALIIQGTSDTLFPVNEAIANYEQILANGVDAKMIWFCGGHTITAVVATSCSAGEGQGAHINARIDAWFARYLKDADVDTGPAIEYQVQDGTWYALDELPAATIDVTGSSRVTHQVAPTSGQVTAPTAGGCRDKDGQGELPSTAWARETVAYAQVCPYASSSWIKVGTFTGPPPDPCGTVGRPPCDPTFEYLKPGDRIVGSPKLTLDVITLLPTPEVYLFFKLISYHRPTNTATVVDDQVMAVKIPWPSTTQARRIEVDMAAVAWEVPEGHETYIEISPSSNDHASSRYPNSTSFSVRASLPVIQASA